jgi:hypothetical protein
MKGAPLEGQRFGRLLVLQRAGSRKGQRLWCCTCDCGQTAVAKSNALLMGHKRSCGCLRGENSKGNPRKMKHGAAAGGKPTPEYRAWHGMISRCHGKRSHTYARYGGRGIEVCERWRGVSGYQNFISDMGPRPFSGAQIDRIDNDGNYCPENCRWATPKRNSRNRSTNRQVTLAGETRPLSDWAEILNLHPQTLKGRLNSGWDEERILNTPSGRRRNPAARLRQAERVIAAFAECSEILARLDDPSVEQALSALRSWQPLPKEVLHDA